MRPCHTRLRPRRLAIVLALLATVLGSGTAGAAPTPPPDDPALAQSVAPDEAAASGPDVIDVGHVDVGPRVVDGQWQVMARDDSGPAPVWRDPAQTVLHVTDAALMDAPTDPAYDFMGGRAGERWYVVPQTQNPDVVWLGWNTQDALALDASAVLDAGAAGATPSTPATTQDASPAPGSGSRATLLVGGGVVVLVLVGGAWILLRARATARERARAQAEVRADREAGTGTGPTAEGPTGTAPDAGAPAGARTDREVRTGAGPTAEGPTGTAQPRGGRE